MPNEALDKCNTAAADVAAEDGDGDDDEGKNGDFASFKEEPMKEDDGYSNEHVSAEILSVSMDFILCFNLYIYY